MGARSVGRLLLVGTGTALAAACTAIGDLDLSLRVTLSTDSPAVAVGEPVPFEFEATGPALIGVVVDYGDGVVDSVQTYGATSARGDLDHAFVQPGSFVVLATVVDAIDGEATDELTVTVAP